jgi:hypothetical protein
LRALAWVYGKFCNAHDCHDVILSVSFCLFSLSMSQDNA